MPAVMHTLKFKKQTVPPEIMKKASSLTGSAFLRYILYEVNEEHREALMLHEKFRLETFQFRWPYQKGSLAGNKMAATGFYAVNDSDRVKCVFCRGSLHSWEQGDNPAVEHANAFPFCPFILRQNCGNKSLVESADSPAYPEYKEYSNRLSTFSAYPTDSPMKATTLCDAGFYFRGTDGGLRCYCCGIIVQSPLFKESLLEKHYPGCDHVSPMNEQMLTNSITGTPTQEKPSRSPLEVNIVQGTEKQNINEISSQLSRVKMDIAPSKDIDDMKIKTNTVAQQTRQQEVEPTKLSAHIARRNRGHQINLQGKSFHCLSCEADGAAAVAASHIGLPCTHLIYCEKCNNQIVEQNKIDSKDLPPCPRCGNTLVGTLCVHFS